MKHKAYKFRLYPNQAQQVFLAKHFGCARFVYNYFLAEKQKQYEETGTSDNYFEQSAKLTQLKKQSEFVWLREVNAQSLVQSLRNLDKAYQNFYKRRGKYPNFKNKRAKNSFSVPQKGKIKENKLFLPKLKEGIEVVVHREIEGTIKSLTVSRTPTGKYFVSVLTEQEIPHLPKTDKEVGVDLGLKDFAITSDGKKYANHNYTKKHEKKLKRAQQHLSRKKKGSGRYEKQRLKVARLHEKIANQRKDNLHKVSRELVTRNDVIVVETLEIKEMMKKTYLAKKIADASWYTFTQMLEYKCDWYGKTLIKVDTSFPSSKTCSCCGEINKGLKLYQRTWTCAPCGTTHDRDINASVNILREGLKVCV